MTLAQAEQTVVYPVLASRLGASGAAWAQRSLQVGGLLRQWSEEGGARATWALSGPLGRLQWHMLQWHGSCSLSAVGVMMAGRRMHQLL